MEKEMKRYVKLLIMMASLPSWRLDDLIICLLKAKPPARIKVRAVTFKYWEHLQTVFLREPCHFSFSWEKRRRKPKLAMTWGAWGTSHNPPIAMATDQMTLGQSFLFSLTCYHFLWEKIGSIVYITLNSWIKKQRVYLQICKISLG